MLCACLLAGPIAAAPRGPEAAPTPRKPAAAETASLGRLFEALPNDAGHLPAYLELARHLRLDLKLAGDRSRSGDLAPAIRWLDDALAAAPNDPRLLYGRGLAAKLSGDYPAAIRHFEASIQAGAAFWGVFDELIPYYRTQAELTGAIGLLERRLAEDPGNACLHQAVGYIHFWLDDYDPAGLRYDLALDLQTAAGDTQAQAVCLNLKAYLGMYLNEYDRARRDIERSLVLSAACGDRAVEVRSRDLLGFLLIEQGRIREAMGLARTNISGCQDLADPKQEARCLLTLGVALMETGDLVGAGDCLERSAGWYRLSGEDRLLEIVLYWQSVLQEQLGDLTGSLDLARQALAFSEREGFRTAQAFNLSQIGRIYRALGHYEKALSYNQRALLISRDRIGKWSREECLNSIGAVYMETGRFPEALASFREALDYIRRIDHLRQAARCHYNIGWACLGLGDEDAALGHFREARHEAEFSGQRVELGLAMIQLGDLALRRGRTAEAEGLFDGALGISVETNHPEISWRAYAGLGDLAARRNRIQEAAHLYERAGGIIEDQRSQLMERQHSAGFFQSKVAVYEKLSNLYYSLHVINPDRGHDRQCFHAAEKAKSRAFLDDLQAARIDPGTFPLSPEARRRIQTLSQEVSGLLTVLSRPDLARFDRDNLWASLERAEEELQLTVEAARRMRPDLSLLLRSEPSRLPEIQSVALEPGTALIEFLVGDRTMFVFYATRDRLKVHRLDQAETAAVRELVQNYVLLLASPGMTAADSVPAARRLYELLILPGRDVLGAGIGHVIVVPDRELCLLPFETLVSGQGDGGSGAPGYLLADYAVTYAPSASALVNILGRAPSLPRSMDWLALGDPAYPDPADHEAPDEWENPVEEYYRARRFAIEPLPYTRREVRALARLFPRSRRTVLLGRDATEEALKRLPLGDYKIIHLAMHSLLDEKVANRSALILTQDRDPAEDGFLQADEIYRTRLNADLVVLSACRTALGKLDKGEGVQGLTRAFLCAGADAVLVSLWPVEDRLTAAFMERFYGHLVRGQTKSEALRSAKLEALRDPAARPHQWAGFILMGEGRRGVAFETAARGGYGVFAIRNLPRP